MRDVSQPSLEEVLQAYEDVRAISDRTAKLYRMTISKFSEFLGHQPGCEDLETSTVSRFLRWRGERVAVATAAKDRAQLRALWEFAARRGFCEYPEIRRIKVPHRMPEAWTIAQMRQIIDACRGLSGTVGAHRASDWWTALVMLAYETGERSGALLGLRWDDVDQGNRSVVFRAETRKGKTADLHRRVSESCLASLLKLGPQRGKVFRWDRHEGLVWRDLGRILRSAGLPSGRRSKFHRFRRTCASHAAARGLDAKEVLDHDSLASKYYLDPRISQSRQPCDVLPEIC